MNGYQRTMTALQHQIADRVPVIPEIIQHALHINNVSHKLYSSNGRKLAESQINALYRYGYDGIHITTDNMIIGEALGNVVYLPEDETPHNASFVLCDSKDLKKLKKVDPHNSGRMPVILEATKAARKELKDNFFIKANCDGGPFHVAASVRGPQQFYTDLYDDERFVFDLLEICSHVIVRYGKAIAASGAHAITFGDSAAVVTGRENYRKFAFPFEKYVIGELKRTNLPVFLHICGNASHILDLMAETGADALEIDSSVDLKYAKTLVGCKVTLEGNVDPIEMLNGSPECIYELCNRCIEVAGRNGGFILSSGCEIPRYTPPSNIDAMVLAAKSS